MKYQICYVSPQGHAEKLALGFHSIFPAGTDVIDLSKENYSDADHYLIGFELLESDIDCILEKIAALLPDVKNKEVLLFATCPVAMDEDFHRSLERRIKDTLLQVCQFRGLFVCRGTAFKTVIRPLLGLQKRPREYDVLAAVQEEYQLSKKHPNRNDIRNGCRFITDAWNLNP